MTTQLTAMQSRTKQLQQQHETEQKIVIETSSLHHNHISTIVNVLVQLQNNQGQRNQVSQVQLKNQIWVFFSFLQVCKQQTFYKFLETHIEHARSVAILNQVQSPICLFT